MRRCLVASCDHCTKWGITESDEYGECHRCERVFCSQVCFDIVFVGIEKTPCDLNDPESEEAYHSCLCCEGKLKSKLGW